MHQAARHRLFFYTVLIPLLSMLFIQWAGALELKLDVIPRQHQVNVSRTAEIVLNFNQPVPSDSLNLIVFGEKSGIIHGKLDFVPHGVSAVFTPAAPFIIGDRITVVLVKQPQQSSILLKNGFIWEFYVKPERGSLEFRSVQYPSSLRLTSIVAADLDNDGIIDLAVTGSRDTSAILQLAYFKSGRLEWGDSVTLPDRVRPIYSGDLNRDGYPDFVLIHRGREKYSIPPRISTCFLSRDGKLSIGQVLALDGIISGKTEPRAAAVNDFNGDGFLDLTVMLRNEAQQNASFVYLNDGTGHFSDQPFSSFDRSNVAESMFSADLNNDGYIDAGVGHSGNRASLIPYLNNGSASFIPAPGAMQSAGRDLEITHGIDLNGDFLPDLLAADYANNQLLVSLLYRIQKTGSIPIPDFQTNPPTSFHTITNPNWMDYGDLDADNDMDVVVSGSNQDSLRIMWNNKGSFDQAQQSAISGQPAKLVVGDLNNDLALDIIVADTTGIITVLFNNIGGFDAPFAPALSEPADGAFTREHQPVFQWQNPVDVNAEDLLFFRITIQASDGVTRIYNSKDNPQWFTPAQPVLQGQGVITFTAPEFLADGGYSWYVEAFDGLFWGVPSTSRRFTIDSTPPSALQLAFPAADYNGRWFAVTADSVITAQLTYDEAHPDHAVLTSGIGGPFVFGGLTGGESVVADLNFIPAISADGEYPVTVDVFDSSGLSTSVDSIVGIDRNPPSGAAAHVESAVSATRQFRVFWSGGSDGSGSGPSGEYRVQYRKDDGPWTVWLARTSAGEALFSGSQNSRYEFEAAAYDRVGFFEPFANVAEAAVLVNIYVNDHTAPSKPLNVMANGANPSPWQAQPEFTVRWSLPADASGIAASFWKLGSAPTSNTDYTKSEAPQGPANAAMSADGVMRFFVWLSDSAGNVDYRNNATVDLRRDSGLPVLQTVTVDEPPPNAVQTDQVAWFNSQTAKTFKVSTTFSELHPRTAVLTTDGLTDSLVNRGAALGSGDPRKTSFSFTVTNPADRVYTLKTTVTDSAANKAAKPLKIGLDNKPPSGSLAGTPAISATETFNVSWSAGSDGTGSGIARYDIYSKTSTTTWQLWHSATAAGQRTFTGQNNVTYSFESRAVDLIGLAEPFSANGETTVRVDLTANDKVAPPPPINLQANGAAPYSPWKTNAAFVITWQKPQDVSGVVSSFWKLGAPPVSNNDTSGVGGKGPAEGPMTVLMNAAGKQWLYVWLLDANGNVDFHNTARVLLRYDNQAPKISATEFLHPAYGSNWFNPKVETAVDFQVTYQELYPDSLLVNCDKLGFFFKTTDLQAGIGVKKVIPFSIAGKPDGVALLQAVLVDSAGNKTSAVDTLKIDSTPPSGATASSPAVLGKASFAVNWSPGTDSGVGVADVYDVFVKQGDQPWAAWLKDFKGRSSVFTGENTKRYAFEVLARDLLGNKEKQTFQAESTTLVDFFTSDSTAPPPPLNLRAADASPSPWQKFRTFTVTWTMPNDPSGIALARYKLGSVPAGNADTSGTIKGGSPATIRATLQNGQMLHVWLQDGAGNVDYRNIASVRLRYDAILPVIDSLVLTDPRPVVDNQWYNPRVLPQKAVIQVYARDVNLARIRLEPSSLFQTVDIAPAQGAAAAAFTLSFPNFADALVDLTVTVVDSAENSAQSVKRLSLDGTPPLNTLAQSPDTTAPGEFTVSWDINQVIETGCGLSGIFSIRLKIDDDPWAVWNSQYVGTSATFTGSAGSRYAFEVAAYDRVGNWEGFSGEAESVTHVRQSFTDTTPPPPPTNLMVNGRKPSVWSSLSEFSIQWTQPTDPSGVAQVYYKFFEPPTGAQDFSGSAAGTPPLKIQAPEQGQIPLYIWLRDGVGNVDHRNTASTLLKYDSAQPEIKNILFTNARFENKWLNPDSTDHAQIRLIYSEANPDSIRCFFGTPSASPVALSGLPAGVDQQVEALIPFDNVNDGCYPLYVVFSDSAGNVAADSLSLCFDRTPPTGATASSPENSTTGRFTITWAGEGAGTDADGSGISGEYDLRMSIGGSPWFELLNRAKTTSYTYVGAQGNAFSFEVAAWDNTGNREMFTGIAETATLVDTAFIDNAAPSAPLAVNVRGKNPSDWQNTPVFTVEWQNPADPSGIVAAFYKLGQPPVNAGDFTDSVTVDQNTGRAVVQVEQDGEHRLYLWLKDGRGNTHHVNSAMIRLRFDGTPPQISAPAPVGQAIAGNWFNQERTPDIKFQLAYDEPHPDSLRVWNEAVGVFRFKVSPANTRNDTLTFSLNVKSAADGAHRLFAAMKDSAGSASGVDSVVINFDSRPPMVTLTPIDSVVEQFKALPVKVSVTDENPLSMINLLYWQGGRRVKTTLPMTPAGDSLFSAEIPAQAVSDRGIEFMVLAADAVNQTRFPADEPRAGSVGARVRIINDNRGLIMPQPVPAGSEENAYRMVAFPLDITNSSPKDVLEDEFGTYDAKVWRLFYWEPLASLYQEYQEIDALRPGKAYWMITSKEGLTLDTGPGITVNTVKPFIVVLKKGWNDIATPFSFAVDWRDIITASAIDTQKVQGPHAYVGHWEYPFENSILQPWQGYSVYSDVEDFSLTIPDLEAVPKLSKKAPFASRPGVDWVFQIAARSGYAEDVANYFGCAKTATDKWDYGFDYVEAPEVGSYVTLYFSHPDWELAADRYTTDFRPAKKGSIWEFEVATNRQNSDVRLVFNPLNRLPKSLSLRLVDAEANMAVDMTGDSTYAFKFSEGEWIRHFSIFAGDAQFMEEHRDDLPEQPSQFELVQNYPNPFNSSTIISYELKEDTDVQLAVFNLLAQKVKQLRSGHQEKGFYQVSWDAHDEQGRELGTGVYILRLETPEFTSTRKMVYIR